MEPPSGTEGLESATFTLSLHLASVVGMSRFTLSGAEGVLRPQRSQASQTPQVCSPAERFPGVTKAKGVPDLQPH